MLIAQWPDDHQPLILTCAADIKEVVFQVDDEGRFSYLSPAWATISGRPAAECLGQYLWQFLDPSDQEGMRQEFLQMVRGGRQPPCSGDYRLRTATNCLRWIGISVRARATDAHAFTGSMDDITSYKWTEQLDALLIELGPQVLKDLRVSSLLNQLAPRLAGIYGCMAPGSCWHRLTNW